MPNLIGYRCSICGQEYELVEIQYTCPKDNGNLDVILDYKRIKAENVPSKIHSSLDYSIWRYQPLLPVEKVGGSITPLHSVGWTPVYQPKNLADSLGIDQLWVKDESSNPTASFKDRASAIVIARAKEIGADTVVTASTGNAGAALAGMAASVGHKAIIFAPQSAPPAKIAQLQVYGARVFLVEGSYDDAFDLTIEASQEFGWYCRNTGYNPFTAEGKKTAAFEIWEWGTRTTQWIKHGNLTPAIFVSVGDGNIISGIHKGFKDLISLGWISWMPRIFGVQAEGSAAIANAFHANNENIIPVRADTLADSISVDMPRDGVRAIRAARETGGDYITVSDDEILAAIADLGKVGIFAEPAGAASLAGLKRALNSGLLKAENPVMVVNTGNGLKDIKAAIQAAGSAQVIEPTFSSLRGVIE